MSHIILTICLSTMVGAILKMFDYKSNIDKLQHRINELETAIKLYEVAYSELNKKVQRKKKLRFLKVLLRQFGTL